MFKISQSKKKAGIHCCAYSCNNKPVKKKGGLCHKHYARKLRILDPVQVRYNQWKGKAKQRGIEHHVTLKQFRKWCEETGYLSPYKRGQNATIDRPDNRFGYYIWNMEILTNRQNSSKGDSLDNIMDNYKPDNFELPF